MNNYTKKVISLISDISIKTGNMPFPSAVRRGLTYLIPVLMIGSFALVFLSLPIAPYQSAMTQLFGEQWKNFFVFIRDGSFNILSIIMLFSISYSYSEEYCEAHSLNASALITAIVAVCSFAALNGISREGYDLSGFGVIGIFIAIFVSYLSSILFLKLSSMKRLIIRAASHGSDTSFKYAVMSIFPAVITISVFAALNQVLAVLLGITDIQHFLGDALRDFFLTIKSPLLSGMLFMLSVHVLWFFGIHGSNILEPVAQSVFVPALTANQQALANGLSPDNIFTKTFFDTFILMGGCGGTLCLILAVLIAGRQKNRRRHVKLSLIPVLFNINELIVFGIPIVFNPVYLIPFILLPLLLTGLSYLAMYTGLVPLTTGLVEWTTPVFLSGYISTGSIAGSLLQLVNLVLGTLVYIPFVKLDEIITDMKLEKSLGRVYSAQHKSPAESRSLLGRRDEIGSISRFLASDLRHDLKNGRLCLYYQPQIDFSGKVCGIEALLRWKHESYGFISPPLIIELAEEAGMTDELGDWILETSCCDLSKMRDDGVCDIIMSVNITALQLESDIFTSNLEELLAKYSLQAQQLKIEVTEQTALSGSINTRCQLQNIKQLGVKLAMDDFGMGHSSLIYLKEFEFDTIKLDSSLVTELISSSGCKNIVSSIISLGSRMNYYVIAEYVEKEEQREALHELGCDMYQGHLYSPALPYDKLMEFIAAHSALPVRTPEPFKTD